MEIPTEHDENMIDFTILESVFASMKGRVKYKLGAKAKMQQGIEDIKQIDCSGFTRYILARATDVLWPDGSQNQLAWARKNLRKLARYSDVQFAKDDPGRLFIAFLSPKPGNEWPRHVWLIRCGKTMESHGSRGVNSRHWDVAALIGCKECFEIK